MKDDTKFLSFDRSLSPLSGDQYVLRIADLIRLGKLFGNDADIWIQIQAAHDVWHASRNVDVSGIPTLKTAT